MQQNTIISKDSLGFWVAKTEIPINHKLVLTITTTEIFGKLVTCAKVAQDSIHMLFTDFDINLLITNSDSKIKESIERQHKEALLNIDLLIDQVKRFYSIS